jgi:hypothetical protein
MAEVAVVPAEVPAEAEEEDSARDSGLAAGSAGVDWVGAGKRATLACGDSLTTRR